MFCCIDGLIKFGFDAGLRYHAGRRPRRRSTPTSTVCGWVQCILRERGLFIYQLIREGPPSFLTLTLLLRLQEKGWDMKQTIEKLLKSGANVSTEALEVVRIPGLITDAEMIGGCGGGGGGMAVSLEVSEV